MPETLSVASIAFVATILASAARDAGTAVPRPIEVEVQPGAVPCAPGNERFDAGFRSVLRQHQLAVIDTSQGTRLIPNVFCLASERPTVKPLHVKVRIRSDGGANYDHAGPAPGAIRTADHWLVHVAVPFRAVRGAPAPWQRISLWARSDRQNYCEAMGRVVALCVLEKLARESGKLRRVESADLGPDLTRDRKYSESGDDWWSTLRHDAAEAFPMLVLWGTFLAIAFALVRFAQRSRRLHRQKEGFPSIRSS
jgi:hypothetical protein